MSVLLKRLNRDSDELERIGRLADGEVVDGGEEVEALFPSGVPGDDDLLDRFDGPTLFAVPVDQAQARQKTALKDVPVLPDDQARLGKDELARWVAWVRSGRPDPSGGDDEAEARQFNPELHPRGPDGKFVERPWDIPDSLDVDSIRKTPTLSLLQELKDAGEPIEAAMSDPNVRIDGIPDDVNSVSEAKAAMGGDGLAFQDLEPGDQIEVAEQTPDGLVKVKGKVERTQQVDGGPNLAHVVQPTGTVRQVPLPDGTTIARNSGPALPPEEAVTKGGLVGEDISEGDTISVITGYQQGDPTHAATGVVDAIQPAPGDNMSVEVNGDKYAIGHDNVQFFDATPETLDPFELEEGDPLTVWSGGKKLSEGTLDNIDTTTGEDVDFVEVDKADSTEKGIYIASEYDFHPPETNDTAEEEPAADTSDGAADDGLPTFPVTTEGGDVLHDFDEASTLGKVKDDDLVDVQPSDVSEGDWIWVQGTGVAYVKEQQGVTDTTVQVGAPDDPMAGGEKSLNLAQGGPGDLKKLAIEGEGLKDEPDASDIDPATVSGENISLFDTDPFDFDADTDGSWVVYEDNAGVHAGQVVDDSPGTGTSDTVQVATGHSSDPQVIGPKNKVSQIPDSLVMEQGEVGGTSTPNTTQPDPGAADWEPGDLGDMPNTETPDPADIHGPVTAGDSDQHGILPEQTVQALRSKLKDGGFMEPDRMDETKNRQLAFPQMNAYDIRSELSDFAEQFGLSDVSGGAGFDNLMPKISKWKGSSYNDKSQSVEKVFHAALNLPGAFRNHDLDGDEPTDDEAVAAALLSATSTEFIRENLLDFETAEEFGEQAQPGEELPLYRGIAKNAVASLARDWAEEPDADAFSVTESKMGNYSTDPQLANAWSEQGHVLKKNSTPEDTVFSPDAVTNKQTGVPDEAEIWLPGGVDGTDPSNIQVKAGGTQQMTMADMNDAPEDMGHDQYEILTNWSEAMNKRDYVLESQSQVETFETAIEQMAQDGFSSYQRKKVEQMVKRSKQALPDADAPEATEA